MKQSLDRWATITTPENRVIHSPLSWILPILRSQKAPVMVLGKVEKENPELIKDLIGKVYIVE